MEQAPTIEMVNITKKFPGILANDNVSFSARPGEIHALLGENGAGKSTLMSILTGLYRPDCGEIRIKGHKVEFHSPKAAIDNGVGMVHQHFKLVKPFTVAENIILGQKNNNALNQYKLVTEKISDFCEKYGLQVDPKAKIWQLSVGEQQRVEIVKVLFKGAEILILDEPTAVLTPQEATDLYRALRKMANQGKTVIIITHKLNEVMENADYTTVLRSGKVIGTVKTNETNENELASMMVGRDLILKIEKSAMPKRSCVLELNNVSCFGNRGNLALNDISLEVFGGEIFGIAGVAGNGQNELAEVIAGIRPVNTGKKCILGMEHTNSSPKMMIDAGVSYIPEDRLGTGLVPNLNVLDNLLLKNYSEFRGWFIDWRKVYQHTVDIVNRFNVKVTNLYSPVKTLSGGNLQKLLLAREISAQPNLIVAVYPMRGLDVGAMEAVRQMLLAQRDAGKAVILISEELEDLRILSDRIAVMYNGEIMGIVDQQHTNFAKIGLMMAGKRMMIQHAG